MKKLLILAIWCLSGLNSIYAMIPLVEFINKPFATQWVKPQQTLLTFYSIRNNTAVNFPLAISFSHPSATLAQGTTCGAALPGKSSCTLVVQFLASTVSRTEPVTISINYQGRAPLRDTITYKIDDNINCILLSKASYQTPFCQNQYQQLLHFTPDVFNITNQNVVQEQTLGGMIGIFQRNSNNEEICFISCGLIRLNGTPPDENTLFELASVTKTFTTSILGKLVYLSSINPLDAIFPYLPPGPWNGELFQLTTNESPVTFQQLATFSGGVCFSDAPSVNIHSGNENLNQSNFVKDINLLDSALATCIGGAEVNVIPEYGAPNYLPTHNHYSNSSVGLLAQALINIDGFNNVFTADFNGWMCNNITTTLEMSHTNGCLPEQALSGTCPANTAPGGMPCNTSEWQNAHYSSGYSVSNGNYHLKDPFPYTPWAGAGSLRSNATDMIKFLRANLGFSTDNSPNQTNLIQGMQLAHAPNQYLPVPAGKQVIPNIGSQTPLLGGQGYAWVCEAFGGDTICGKIGGHEGYRSFVGFSKNKKYGIVLLFNTGATKTNGSFRSLQTSPPTIGEIGTNMIQAQ